MAIKLDSSKWIPSYQWGQTHNYNAYCDPNNVLIENGLLRLKVEDKPSHGKKYTSAVITSYGKFSQKYGYFEGRFRIPMGKGLWPAFWMLPYPQHWPPEIDIFETIKDDPQIHMNYHWSDQGHKSSGKALDRGRFLVQQGVSHLRAAVGTGQDRVVHRRRREGTVHRCPGDRQRADVPADQLRDRCALAGTMRRDDSVPELL